MEIYQIHYDNSIMHKYINTGDSKTLGWPWGTTEYIRKSHCRLSQKFKEDESGLIDYYKIHGTYERIFSGCYWRFLSFYVMANQIKTHLSSQYIGHYVVSLWLQFTTKLKLQIFSSYLLLGISLKVFQYEKSVKVILIYIANVQIFPSGI